MLASDLDILYRYMWYRCWCWNIPDLDSHILALWEQDLHLMKFMGINRHQTRCPFTELQQQQVLTQPELHNSAFRQSVK